MSLEPGQRLESLNLLTLQTMTVWQYTMITKDNRIISKFSLHVCEVADLMIIRRLILWENEQGCICSSYPIARTLNWRLYRVKNKHNDRTRHVFLCHIKNFLNVCVHSWKWTKGQVVETGWGHGCSEGGLPIVNSASSIEMWSHTKS